MDYLIDTKIALARFREFYKAHATIIVIATVLFTCVGIVAYQAYAYQHVKENKKVAAQVVRLSKTQCANTTFFYTLLNGLALDTSVMYGSPPTATVPVPGARSAAINKLFRLERRASKGLLRQGCDLRKIIPEDLD